MTEQEINNLIDSKIGKTKMSQLPEATQTSGLYSIGYTGNQSVKYKANLLQGDPLTVRKTYQTEAEALADKNPIDTTTSLPLTVGQFISIVDDGEKNGIYRIGSISGDGTMSLELQGKLGDLSFYAKKSEVDNITISPDGTVKKDGVGVNPKTTSDFVEGEDWILTDKINDLTPKVTITSNQLFNNKDFLTGVAIHAEHGGLLDDEGSLTTKIIKVEDNSHIQVRGLNPTRIKVYRFLNENMNVVEVSYISGNSNSTSFDLAIPDGAVFFQLNFKKYTDPDDSVINNLFIYFGQGEKSKDAYSTKVTIDGVVFREEVALNEVREIYMDNIPNTNSSTLIEEDVIVSITHNRGGVILRVDNFDFLDDSIIETRIMNSGEKLVYTYNLITLTTEEQYYGI